MKRLFNLSFVMILFLLFCGKVNAETTYPNDIEVGDIYSREDVFDVIDTYYGTVLPFMSHIVYLDKNDNLLYAFTASNGFEFTYAVNGGNPNYYLGTKVDFNFGSTCEEVYEEFDDIYLEWCEDYLTMYSSSTDISTIKYWKTISVDKTLYDFCDETEDVQNSYSCNEGIGYNGFELIVLKEYSPVSFELLCEPKEVKKGETSNCELKINAFEEINELKIPLNSDLFYITKYNEAEGWELVDNEDGTVTIKSEDGFKGECVILGATIKFKEDLTDDVEIALNDIHYVTADGIELNGSAKDNITIYEEPVVENPKVEDTKEEVDNPNTFDNVSLISVLSLVTIFIALMIYRLKNIIR